jgi:polyferredoxin
VVAADHDAAVTRNSRLRAGGPGDEEHSVRVTILRIKAVHTAIFVVLSACVLFALYSGLAARITSWTWAAVALVVVESIVLVSCGWRCPLTILAERLGAKRGAVTDLFLPKWFADRIFPVCGTTFLIACILLVVRLLVR